MTIEVKHKFLSAKSDSLDSTRVQPSNWNDDHDIEMAPSSVIGRGSGAGNAPAEELPAGTTGRALLATGTQADALTAIGAAPASSATTAATVGTAIAGTATKATPVDADSFTILDSAAASVLKRVLWSAVKATLKTYFDTLYATAAAQLEATWQAGTGVVESVVSPAKVKAASIAAGAGAPHAVLEDQKASGTGGGSFTGGVWVTRELNTEVRDPDGLITLGSNQFVPLVNGWVEWSAPAFKINTHKTRLYNVTDAVVAGVGTAEYATTSDGAPSTIRSSGGAAVVAGKTYRIEHQCSAGRANSDALGNPASFATTEVYTRVRFWRTA